LMLSSAAVIALLDSFRWWSRYGSYFRSAPTLLMMMRLLTPAVWSIAVGILVAVTAKKVVARNAM
jgi:hypothetical protein